MSESERPAALGYRWPAEWEHHAATWLAWPHNRNTWPGKFEPVPAKFAALVETIARFEPVNVLAGIGDVYDDARRYVGHLNNVTLHHIETNDAWTRDHGPTFLAGPKSAPPVLVDWEYNAWGGKYPPFDKDNQVPRQIANVVGYRRFTPGIILEGGAIETNGQGTILTTESCLLNPNRNPTISREMTEQYLRDYCCAKKILWLRGAEMAGDDTDGHIDQLARFVDARTVVVATENDAAESNYQPLQDIGRQLREMSNESDEPLTVLPLPMPRPKYHDEQRLPASYANYYVANGLVVVPQFDDPSDAVALAILARCFPDREVIGLDAVDLVWGLGAFHCLTQQQPYGVGSFFRSKA